MPASTPNSEPTKQPDAAMVEELRRTGHLTRPYRDESERDQLRDQARRAARTLGRPIRTHADADVDAGTMIAALADWPANPLEARLSESRANNIIDRALGE
ncbi:hypothetical protein AB0L06_43060 [Spirillospora sp. NPDC052269]